MSNVVRRSMSSPKKSRRIGSFPCAGHTSTMPPRTANSARCSTKFSRRYPIEESDEIKLSRSSDAPRRTFIGATSSSGERSCATDLADATRMRGRSLLRSLQRSSERIAMTELSGLTRSRGWVSHPGHKATQSSSLSSAPSASRRTSASVDVAVTTKVS